MLKRTKNITLVFLVPPGGRKKAVPANTVDTLRGGRKGDPRHKAVGKTLQKTSVMVYSAITTKGKLPYCK